MENIYINFDEDCCWGSVINALVRLQWDTNESHTRETTTCLISRIFTYEQFNLLLFNVFV